MWEATARGIPKVGFPIFAAITVPIRACALAVIYIKDHYDPIKYGCQLLLQHLTNINIWVHTKSVKRIFCFTLALITFLIFINSCSAVSRRAVLGAETDKLTMPPTIEGPGIILPDSPFYFLDQLKQNTRLFLAFTPEAKTRVYNNIAGERMAELRFMLVKQNEEGLRIALAGLSQSYKNAVEQLAAAKLSGKDVNKLAKDINDSIKLKQEVIDELIVKAEGETNKQLQAALEGITEAKIKSEEYLYEEDLANEIKYDVNREVELQMQETFDTSESLKEALLDLQEQRKQASENELKNREKALVEAIDKQSEAIQKEEQKSLELEKKTQAEVAKLEEAAIKEVQDLVVKAQQAALKYQSLQATQ